MLARVLLCLVRGIQSALLAHIDMVYYAYKVAGTNLKSWLGFSLDHTKNDIDKDSAL